MDKKKLEKIYIKNSPSIYRFFAYKLGNQNEAEDMTSEVFVRFINSDKKNLVNAKSFLFGIARNVLLEKYRERFQNKVDLSVTEEFIPDQLNFEKEYVSNDLVEKIKNELTILDPTTQDIIRYKIWEELSFLEIGTILNLNENTVKTLFYRGIKVLQNRFEKKNHKIYSIGAMIGGIALIAKSKNFVVSQSLNNLFITTKSMDILSFFSLKALTGTFGGKIAMLAITSCALVVGGFIGTSIANNQNTSLQNDNYQSANIINNPVSLPQETKKNEESKIPVNTTVTENIKPIENPQPTIQNSAPPQPIGSVYQNSDFGIRIVYPKNFVEYGVIYSPGLNPEELITLGDEKSKPADGLGSGQPWNGFTLNGDKNIPNLSVTQYIEEYKNKWIKTCMDVEGNPDFCTLKIVSSQINIGSTTAYSTKGWKSIMGGALDTVIFVKHPTKNFIFIITKITADFVEFTESLNGISFF